MDKSQLIATILAEVKDPILRDKLLAQVVDASNQSAGQSLLLSELEKLGVNPQAAKDLVGFQLKTGIFIGHLIGGLFLLGGGFVALVNLLAGNLAVTIFAGFFAAAGACALASARRLARLNKKVSLQPKEREMR